MATGLLPKLPSKCLMINIPKCSKLPKLPRFRLQPKAPKASPSQPPPNNIIATHDDGKYSQVFQHFDRNEDGKISSDELSDYFASTGETLSQDDARRVIRDFDSDGDGLLGFRDFVRLMEKDGEVEGEGDLRRAFQMFQAADGDGCGSITPSGLQQMLRRLGKRRSCEECLGMISAFDLDGNGVLDFNEFRRMMT